MVFVNYLYERKGNFEIKTNLGFRGYSVLASVELSEGYAKVETIDEETYNELTCEYEEFFPTYSHYLNALVSSGVLKVEGIEELIGRIVGEFKKDIYKRPRPLYVSLDTNCFVNRISYQLERAVTVKKEKLGAFVVADGVKKELFKEGAGKYREEELRFAIVKDKNFAEFLNQPKVVERIKKMGKAEYNRFRSSVRFEEIPSGIGDNEIAEALGNFSRDRNCDVWLLTFDKTMYEVSAGFGIQPVLLEFPRRRIRERLKTDWECVCDLIYTMAVVFGFVSVGGVTVYGIWRGKGVEDWNAEKVKVGRMIESIERDLKILDRIKKIMQDKSYSF